MSPPEPEEMRLLSKWHWNYLIELAELKISRISSFHMSVSVIKECTCFASRTVTLRIYTRVMMLHNYFVFCKKWLNIYQTPREVILWLKGANLLVPVRIDKTFFLFVFLVPNYPRKSHLFHVLRIDFFFLLSWCGSEKWVWA